MTLDQLRIFVAVAERQHVTRAAEALNLTQSAVSSAIRTLSIRYDVRLFQRVGRRIELTDVGHLFLDEARGVLRRVEAAELALVEYRGVGRGTLKLVASQTIASYWLPAILAAFRRRYAAIELTVMIANTEGAAKAVRDGVAELGFVEGSIADQALVQSVIATDRMRVVGLNPMEAGSAADIRWIADAPWIMRERGSGTRSTFEDALRAQGVDPEDLNVALTLPSNEAVLAAVQGGAGYAVLSEFVTKSAVAAGAVSVIPIEFPERAFSVIHQKERYRTKAAEAFLAIANELASDFYVI